MYSCSVWHTKNECLCAWLYIKKINKCADPSVPHEARESKLALVKIVKTRWLFLSAP